MKYDVYNVGESEFLFGWDHFMEKTKDNPIFISANIIDPSTKKPIFPAYTIKNYTYLAEDSKKKEKIKIAIVGLLGESQRLPLQNNLQADSTRCMITNPIDALNELFPTLKKKADIVVVLAHMSEPEGKELAKQVIGIDIMITGHDGIRIATNPQLIDKTLQVVNGDRGRFASTLELQFNKDKKIAKYKGNDTALSPEVPDDPEMAKLVSTYQAAVNPNKPTTPQHASPTNTQSTTK